MSPQGTKKPNLLALMKPYGGFIWVLVLCTLLANGLNLAVPKIISQAIDAFTQGGLDTGRISIAFSVVAGLIFLFTYLQGLMQTFAAEKVARDLRTKIAAKISTQDAAFVDSMTPSKLLTNLTADVDAVKNFIAQGVASVISSVFLIVGSAVLLFVTNWRLALIVLSIVPLIGAAFAVIFGKVRKLFTESQKSIDWLNKVINESILGAALIRLLNARQYEEQKFLAANTESKRISLAILNLFASLIPIITFLTNVATLAILYFGGRYVVFGSMSLGSFTAFNSYLSILIFPIIIIGFTSTIIAQASASYARILAVLDAEGRTDTGTLETELVGEITLDHLTLEYGEKAVLKDVSIAIKPGTRTAIIGPTAAGKTQLLSIMTGLVLPTKGTVLYDGTNIQEYAKGTFYSQIGLVFQDSVMFNTTLRENIAFGATVTPETMQKAIETAELGDFIDSLPEGLETIVSERGTSLSGGQKQRVMLARALALNPKILLLDDFTARVDGRTEKKILANVRANYPHLTLVSVTQKISSVEDYDQIVVLMEGEILSVGTHAELLARSPEYVQMYDSQESTEHYELHA